MYNSKADPYRVVAVFKAFVISFISFLFLLTPAFAKQGCCSHHGGVAYCGDSGYYMCNDGTRSPSCECYTAPAPQPAPIYTPPPEPVPVPQPEPTPDPVYFYNPEPTPAPAPVPEPTPAPAAVPEPVPAPQPPPVSIQEKLAEKTEPQVKGISASVEEKVEKKEEAEEEEESDSTLGGVVLLGLIGYGYYWYRRK